MVLGDEIMAKTTRFYLSPVIGTGTTTDPYTLKISEHLGNKYYLIPSKSEAEGGAPIFDWGLCKVEAEDHAPILADATVTEIPFTKSADLYSSGDFAKTSALETELGKKGVTLTKDANTKASAVLKQITESLDTKLKDHPAWRL